MFKTMCKKMEKKDGTIYELTTWNTMLKTLFSRFSQQNIHYNFKNDFNGTVPVIFILF